MRKLEIADPEVMRIAIQQEIARSDESRYDHRLHGLLLVTGGQSCQQVAELFGEDRRTVQRWVGRFETHGLGRACARAKGRGDRPRWTPGNGRCWSGICDAIPRSSAMLLICGTASCSRSICDGAMG